MIQIIKDFFLREPKVGHDDPLGHFYTQASLRERERVYRKVIEATNKDQRAVIKNSEKISAESR